jgi:RNA polymerase sigma-B factor
LTHTLPATRQESDDALFQRYQAGDISARESLVTRYMPMARRQAAHYANSREARADLEQVAYVGLLKTIDRYDADTGSFTAYAVTSIRGELKRHFRDKGWGVRMSRPLQQRWLRVNAATQALTTRLGRSPTPRDVAEATNLTVEEVLEAMEAGDAYSPTPLDAPVGSDEGTTTLGDLMGREDPGYATVEMGATIAPVMAGLPDRERQILHLRFVEDLTQTEIADRFGISQMHVSRLLRRSLTALSDAVDGEA